MNNLYIWGWWQGKNLGDNWIKKTLVQLFPEAIFIDTSIQKFEDNSFVVCGGGGLYIYDVITPWNKELTNISYGMLGLGAEFPHNTNIAQELYKNSKFFYLRDEYSIECMKLNGIDRSYDITFAIPLKIENKDKINMEKVFFVWRDGIDLKQNELFNEYIGKSCEESKWKGILDKKFASVVCDDFQTEDDNIEQRIGDAGFVISGRYHGIVAAIQKGLPFIAIDICPKIRALVQEVGLEKYCIKQGEIENVAQLIDDAKNEIDYIRKKEREYVKTARNTLEKQIIDAKIEILKVLEPINIIHYGSYWMKENDVVNTMSDDLNECCSLEKVDLKTYEKECDSRVKKIEKTPNGQLCLLDHEKIVEDINRTGAEAIVLNSGGLYLEDKTYDYCKKNGVLTIGISLSDPDVYPYNGEKYAEKYDLFYTNSKYSYLNQYDKKNVNIHLMPFAASVKHHYYMPEIKRKYDVVVVAHVREDRLQTINKLREMCNVGLYGGGWPDSLGEVNGIEHVKAINKGKMYLSFARTMAGFENVKVGVFEAVACNQVVITSYMEELKDYFKIDEEIICYKCEEELYEKIKYYLLNEDKLEKIREKSYRNFLKNHTYEKRWNELLKEIYCQKGEI